MANRNQRNPGNPDQTRDSEGRFTESRFPTGPVVAVASAAAAAAAGAFLWSRRNSEEFRPLMKWREKGQDRSGSQSPASGEPFLEASGAIQGTPSRKSSAGNTGLDKTSKSGTKAGSISY